MKVKNEIMLKDWVHKIVVPMKLKDRIIYVDNDCKDIWDWSEKMYRIIES